jgi:hypothetical protein
VELVDREVRMVVLEVLEARLTFWLVVLVVLEALASP